MLSNILNGMGGGGGGGGRGELWPVQGFGFRGDKYMKKVKVVSLACGMPTGTPLYPYK